MNNQTRLIVAGLLFFALLVAISIGVDNALNVASQSASTIMAYYVPNAQIDLGHPGQELFWDTIPWVKVPMEPTVPAPGSIAGHTQYVQVKMAWTYVDNVPYIMVLVKGLILGTQQQIVDSYASPSSELAPDGKIWAPFGFFLTSPYTVNVTYNPQNESYTNIVSLPVAYQQKEISYPPGWTLSNPIQIVVNYTNGELSGWVLGAVDVNGNPLNGGSPIKIRSLNITTYIPDVGNVHITSLQQFVQYGLNGTFWAQGAYNLFYPQDTAEYVSLFHNATYVYPLRVAVMWDLSGVPTDWFKVAYTPHMVLGTPGAFSAGSADVWHWNSNPSSNNTLDTSYQISDTIGTETLQGKVWTLVNYTHCPQYADPLNLGFLPHQGMLNDMFVNGSSIYFIGGIPFLNSFPVLNNPSISAWNWLHGNYTPKELWDPALVATGDRLEVDQNGQTYLYVEFARTFSTQGVTSCIPNAGDESKYQVQFEQGKVYHVAFALFQGAIGESVDFKSISLWWNVYIQPSNGQSGPLSLLFFTLGQIMVSPAIVILPKRI
jgi:hypothetical protein